MIARENREGTGFEKGGRREGEGEREGRGIAREYREGTEKEGERLEEG